MRFTKKDRYGHFYTNEANCRNVWSLDGKKLEGEFFENQTLAIDGNAIEKLGQLEDSEEEYGIDLVTLFKALKNGFYYKKQGIVHTSDRESYIFLSTKSCLPNQMCIEVYFGDLEMMCFYFNDYGKTWALSREELETQKENKL